MTGVNARIQRKPGESKCEIYWLVGIAWISDGRNFMSTRPSVILMTEAVIYSVIRGFSCSVYSVNKWDVKAVATTRGRWPDKFQAVKVFNKLVSLLWASNDADKLSRQPHWNSNYSSIYSNEFHQSSATTLKQERFVNSVMKFPSAGVEVSRRRNSLNLCFSCT